MFFAWNFKQIFSPFYNAIVSHEKFEIRQKQKTIFQLYRLFMCRRFNCILYAYSTISALKCQVLSWRCIKAKIRHFNAVKVNSPTARFRTVEEFFSARFFLDLTIEKIPPLTKNSVIRKTAIFAQTVIFGTSGFTEKAPRFCTRLSDCPLVFSTRGCYNAFEEYPALKRGLLN